MERQHERRNGRDGQEGEGISGSPQGSAAAFMKSGEGYGRALFGWQNALLRFASNRLRQQADFGEALIQCRDWKEAARLQQDWMASMVRDYADEASRLLRMSAELGRGFAETTSQGEEDLAGRGADFAERAGKQSSRAAMHSRPRRRQRDR
jgi:hypothetical protein